jgi:hypothetical protein
LPTRECRQSPCCGDIKHIYLSPSIRFRISREALADHFSERDRLGPDAAFEKHCREIEGIARRKYLLGRKEADATVLIETLDIVG